MKAKPFIKELKHKIDTDKLINSLNRRSYPFFLESRMQHNQFGRFSFYGSDPFLVLKSKGKKITIETDGKKTTKPGDPFKELQRLLDKYKVTPSKHPIPFTGGAVGYLGYDLCHFIDKLPRTTKDDLKFPDMFFGFYNQIIAVDHINNKNYIIFIPFKNIRPIKDKLFNERLYKTNKRVKLHSNFTKPTYTKTISRTKEYIAAGDIYQANISQRFTTEFSGSALELYQRLFKINPAPFSAFLRPETGRIVISSSPERFISLKDGVVQTRPIKGTRPRGSTKQKDRKLKRELFNSKKDYAELAMIVDLERNDLGRVCKYGSVKVTQRKVLESYPTVHHLVATVKGKLNPKCDTIDLLKATFPGGSITGAPKIRAMEIIDELEPTRRGPYTGAIGWIGFDKTMDLSIAIRIVLLSKPFNKKVNTVYYQVGGGIVSDSKPLSEYKETLDKGKALKQALL